MARHKVTLIFIASILMILMIATTMKCNAQSEIIIEVPIEPVYTYNVTSAEREMLARLVYREGNTESMECQKAIVSVVINRWQAGYWGDTIKNVIYAKGQFSTASLLDKTTPTEKNYQAVDEVLQHGVTIPEYIMYFRASYGFSKIWSDYGYEEYKQIDNTFFGYFTKDIK